MLRQEVQTSARRLSITVPAMLWLVMLSFLLAFALAAGARLG